jgi:uncharacterized repeat protein (TIGR03803 family)
MDAGGNLYGTAGTGGDGVGGTVFELSQSGGTWTEQAIYSTPTYVGDLTIDAAGNIFGVTLLTVFELLPNGHGGWNPTTIYSYISRQIPAGHLALDRAGNLYGVTQTGGKGLGAVFRLSFGNGKWTRKVLYSFNGNGVDGFVPSTGVVLDAAGNIYGATSFGGQYHDGTIFELVAPVGKRSYVEKILWNLDATDGLGVFASLVLDNAGNLYGTTSSGGARGKGVVFELTP